MEEKLTASLKSHVKLKNVLDDTIIGGAIVSRGSKGYFVIESDQKIIELRNQDSNTLTKMLLEKLYELGFSDTEIIKMFEEYVATKNK